MNKYDIGLIIVLIITSFSFLFFLNDSNSEKEAVVYYESKEVLRIDMKKDGIYNVSGKNGKVVIEVLEKRVRIKEETSPNNICSKLGFIDKSYQSLVCLPNKIVVKIEEASNIDAVIN